MKKLSGLIILFIALKSGGQELYVFSEPASNMPAHSLSAKLTGHFVTNDKIYGRFTQRYMPEVMLGISKKLMVHLSATMSNMHTNNFRFESYSIYAKYRFLSIDDIHKHFRMAVFTDASHTNAPFHYDEITLMGDKSGIEAGLIATQLWNKLAVSGTVSHTQVLDESRNSKVIYVPARSYESLNYSLSAGYLLFPKEYTSYKQLNINFYTAVLAQQTLDQKKHYVDLAPALQFIFNSNSKLNIGYRFEVSGDMQRMATTQWLVSFERTFLNALGKKKGV
ncbi:MAG TPA: hypothetical protein VKC90_05740 [Chitinophagaceae bacterium]|nr:hypothetical protein [Chitinophagaceae bacterium]